MSLKFRIKDVFEEMTPAKWFINKLLNNRVAFQDYSEVLKLAEIAAVIPVSNEWPENASRLKLIKSTLRSS